MTCLVGCRLTCCALELVRMGEQISWCRNAWFDSGQDLVAVNICTRSRSVYIALVLIPWPTWRPGSLQPMWMTETSSLPLGAGGSFVLRWTVEASVPASSNEGLGDITLRTVESPMMARLPSSTWTIISVGMMPTTRMTTATKIKVRSRRYNDEQHDCDRVNRSRPGENSHSGMVAFDILPSKNYFSTLCQPPNPANSYNSHENIHRENNPQIDWNENFLQREDGIPCTYVTPDGISNKYNSWGKKDAFLSPPDHITSV